MQLSRLYAILDAACFADAPAMFAAAEQLAAGGAALFQYRNKSGNAREMLEHARDLKRRLGSCVKLTMNDRADLALAADFDGLHIGQDDLSPAEARRLMGPDRWVGISTHNPEQIAEADQTDADYLVIGPVFATTSKALVAIGGITRNNARSVIEAGADSVAVISDLIREPRKSAETFFEVLR